VRKRLASMFCAVLAATHLLLPLSAQKRPDTPRFRVAVDAVRIDAVVTDRDGRIVSDLTAADFEVHQDGNRQSVTFAQFVPVLAGGTRRPGPKPRCLRHRQRRRFRRRP